jgi:hypothetical protein
MRFSVRAFLPENRHWSAASWEFAILSVFLPNALYLAMMIYFCPIRNFQIGLLAMLVLLGTILARWSFYFVMIFAMSLDALLVASVYFQMPVAMFFDATKFVSTLQVQHSAMYVMVFGAVIMCFFATNVVVQRAKRRRSEMSLYPFAFCVMLMVFADTIANTTPQKMQEVISVAVEPFSAVDDTATTYADLGVVVTSSEQPNLLVVIVEGLGAFSNSESQELVWGPLLGKMVSSRYDVYTGNVLYSGSTSTAEIRELCNLFADYRDLRDIEHLDCLPNRAKEVGYETAAFHAFTGEFFERVHWYPKIGFENIFFLENRAGLNEHVPISHCGTTFRGMCDADVAGSVEAFLLSESSGAKFAYWLTLNSHKPVGRHEVPDRLNCWDGGVFDDQELCRMAEHWLNISHLVSDIAMNPLLRDTEILLVGDHQPPLFTRHGRRQFQDERVAWLHLSPRNSSENHFDLATINAAFFTQ